MRFLSIISIIIGLMVLATGLIRWTIIYIDYSEAVTWSIISLGFIFIGWVYNVNYDLRNVINELRDKQKFLEERQDALGALILGIEKQTVKSKATGENHFSFANS